MTAPDNREPHSMGGHWKDPETGELKWTFPSRAAIVPDPELQVAEAVRRAAGAPPQSGDAARPMGGRADV